MELSTIILFAILIMTSVWDLRTYKIPNAFIIIGLFLGITLSSMENGWSGFFFSVASVVFLFLLLFPLWALSRVGIKTMGAGDVKLFMVAAAFIGIGEAVVLVGYSVIAGSLLFLFFVSPRRLQKLGKDLLLLFIYRIPLESQEKMRKISFAFPILCVYFMQYNQWI